MAMGVFPKEKSLGKVRKPNLTILAQLRRSQEKAKKGDIMYQYKLVIGGFVLTMVGAGVYTLLNP